LCNARVASLLLTRADADLLTEDNFCKSNAVKGLRKIQVGFGKLDPPHCTGVDDRGRFADAWTGL
jgi:hypothetical protein